MTNVTSLLPQSYGRPTADRIAEGKALRKRCSRVAAGRWTPAAGRADPIDLLIADSDGRVSDIVPLRYGRMLASPFAFYRGAACLMAHDLAHTPESGLPIFICGDAHLMNFGGFATPERRLIFDINDFDEASIAPWEWDVKRLATSFHIAAVANRFGKADRDALAREAARSYRLNMARYATMPVLEAYYEFIDLKALENVSARDKAIRLDRESRSEVRDSSANVSEFAKLAHIVDGKPRIIDHPPLVMHLEDLDSSAQYQVTAKRMMTRFRTNLAPERRLLLDRYALADVAIKVTGIGSVGTRCGVALFVSGNGDPLFLQFKEARASVLEAYAGRAPFKHAGERVVFAQRLMQAASDIFLAQTQGADSRPFYVRQLRDAKISPDITSMSVDRMKAYARGCGWALARAHKRSADAAKLNGYLGSSGAFDDAMVEFACSYAAQNARDHAALVTAAAKGRITARSDAS